MNTDITCTLQKTVGFNTMFHVITRPINKYNKIKIFYITKL